MDSLLPRLRSDIRLSRFEEAAGGAPRYLVEADGHYFAVSEPVHRLIASLQTLPANTVEFRKHLGAGIMVPPDEKLADFIRQLLPAALFEDHAALRKSTPIWLRFTLIPESLTQRITRHLTWLFNTCAAGAVVTCFILVNGWSLLSASAALREPLSTGEFCLIVLLLQGTILIHEFGHASACARYGVEPGPIGVGLYLVFPCFYTDVSRAWSLAPRHRAMVDIGGLYFQCIPVTGLAAAALYTGNPALLQAQAFALILMLGTLNPAFKTDGYWLLSDLGGLTNLHQLVTRAVASKLRRGRGPCPSSLERLPPASTRLLALYTALVLMYGAALISYLIHTAQLTPAQYARIKQAASVLRGHASSTPLSAMATDLLLDMLRPAFGLALISVLLLKILSFLRKVLAESSGSRPAAGAAIEPARMR